MKSLLKHLLLAAIMGGIYCGLEMLWRGRTHWTMALLGGLCGVCIGLINELFPWDLGLLWQSLIGAGLVTVLELITGLIVNVWLGWDVWDYSHIPFNFMGQICLPFACLWIVLSCVCIVLDDWLRYWLFHEERPHYTFI